MFTFIIPIYRKQGGFIAGYMWGLLFYSIHMLWFAHVLMQYTKHWLYVYLSAVMYYSLYAGIWLWLQKYLMNRLGYFFSIHKMEYVTTPFTWVISTVTFWYVTCFCSLALFGCFEGYFLLNPLLPLISLSSWLEPIFYCGTMMYWLIIVLINIVLAEFCMSGKKKYIFAAYFFIALPIIVSYFDHKNSVNVQKFAYIQPTWIAKNMSEQENFWKIHQELISLAKEYPDVDYVIIPESSFPHPINKFDSQIGLLSSLFLPQTIIFLGCHILVNEKLYNCVACICHGKIDHVYKKSHLVPLVERVPNIFGYYFFENVFTDRSHVFSYPEDGHKEGLYGLDLRICSEFFCEPRSLSTKYPLIILANDSWFNYGHTLDLVYYSVYLAYLRLRKPIVYAGSYDCLIVL